MRIWTGSFGWRCWLGLGLGVVFIWAAARQLTQPLWDEPVLVVELGGTYGHMLEKSTTPFTRMFPGHIWMGIPRTDARLRFVDPRYGFETPSARYFTVTFDDKVIRSIRMSPQVEPLLIDDALKVVLDLQAQWCAKGWRPVGTRDNPTIADTPEWRAYLRKGILAGTSHWQAGDKYQATLYLYRFRDSRHLDQERYLITLAVAEPWTPFEEIEKLPQEPRHFPPPQPKKGATPCPIQPS